MMGEDERGWESSERRRLGSSLRPPPEVLACPLVSSAASLISNVLQQPRLHGVMMPSCLPEGEDAVCWSLLPMMLCLVANS